MRDLRCGDSSERSRNSPRLPVVKATKSGIWRALETPKPERKPEELAKSREPAACEVRRRFHEEWLEVAREPGEAALEREEPLAIGRRKPAKHFAHARVIVPPGQHDAVRRHRLHGRVRRDHAKSMPVELEIADHLGPQHARHVGGRGHPAARRARGVDLFRHRAAAEDLAPLEHEHGKSRACEVESRRQAVVSAADDDDVVALCCHGAAVSRAEFRPSRRGAGQDNAGCPGSGLPSARRSRRGTRAIACRAALPRRRASPAGSPRPRIRRRPSGRSPAWQPPIRETGIRRRCA